MSGLSKKTIAVLAILAMLAPVSVCAFGDVQDTSAESIDYTKYYYNKLDTDIAKKYYNDVVALNDGSFDSDGKTLITVSMDKETIEGLFPAGLRTADMIGTYVNSEIKKAIRALSVEQPSEIYFLKTLDYSTSIHYEEIGGNITSAEMQVQYEKIVADYPSIAACDAQILSAVEDAVLEDTSTKVKTVESIHKYVVDALTYDVGFTHDEKRVRSLYTALVGWEGDHTVVCEGYAKMFKTLCDANDIPCIILTGNAIGEEGDEPEGHMWNYVYMEDVEKWYLVDCTWDDHTMVDTYLLAGSECDGFHLKISESHHPDYISELFDIPTISSLSYYDSRLEYKVTFKSDGVTVGEKFVPENECVAAPETPVWEYHNFLYWYEDDDTVAWDFAVNKITKDTTLNAKWTAEPIWTVTFDTTGGSKIDKIVVIQNDPPTAITISEGIPTKENATFKEWNTNKDGKGISFAPGDSFTPTGDITIYAIWNNGDTSPMHIDSTVEDIAKFLSEETVPGISNSNLVIGIVVGVVVILSLLVISRK